MNATTPRGPIRRHMRWLVPLAVVALAFGHWSYHYAPRERPAVAVGPEAALLDLPWAEAAVWLPYPHQNLAALEDRAGLVRQSGQDVLALAEVETPRLPSFGGMLSPPASALAMATGANGELAVAARIYPSFAAFARLAGLLAKNPWLGGGEVEWQGRRIEVGWRDGVWLAGSPSLPELRPPRFVDVEASLLVANVRRPSSPLPAGRYRLRTEGDDVVVRSSSAEGLGDTRAAQRLALAPALEASRALLLVVAEGAAARSEGRAMALFSQSSDALTELPRAAGLHRGEQRFKLPAESLLKLAGHDLLGGNFAGYSLVATDRAAYDGAVLLAPALESRLESPFPPELELWLRLGPAAGEMARITGGLEHAPFISRRRLRRWQSGQRLLEVLSGQYETLHLEVSQTGALVLRIERARASR